MQRRRRNPEIAPEWMIQSIDNKQDQNEHRSQRDGHDHVRPEALHPKEVHKSHRNHSPHDQEHPHDPADVAPALENAQPALSRQIVQLAHRFTQPNFLHIIGRLHCIVRVPNLMHGLDCRRVIAVDH